jgi:hypothetical protein
VLAAIAGMMAAAFGLTSGLAFLMVGPLALVLLTPPTIEPASAAEDDSSLVDGGPPTSRSTLG